MNRNGMASGNGRTPAVTQRADTSQERIDYAPNSKLFGGKVGDKCKEVLDNPPGNPTTSTQPGRQMKRSGRQIKGNGRQMQGSARQASREPDTKGTRLKKEDYAPNSKLFGGKVGDTFKEVEDKSTQPERQMKRTGRQLKKKWETNERKWETASREPEPKEVEPQAPSLGDK